MEGIFFNKKEQHQNIIIHISGASSVFVAPRSWWYVIVTEMLVIFFKLLCIGINLLMTQM